jgi:hypothetical protein
VTLGGHGASSAPGPLTATDGAKLRPPSVARHTWMLRRCPLGVGIRRLGEEPAHEAAAGAVEAGGDVSAPVDVSRQRQGPVAVPASHEAYVATAPLITAHAASTLRGSRGFTARHGEVCWSSPSWLTRTLVGVSPPAARAGTESPAASREGRGQRHAAEGATDDRDAGVGVVRGHGGPHPTPVAPQALAVRTNAAPCALMELGIPIQ